MRFVHALATAAMLLGLLLALMLVSAVAGAAGLQRDAFVDFALEDLPFAISFAAALLAIVLLWVLTGLRMRRAHRYLRFDNPGGEVRVSLEAVADYLRRIGRDQPALLGVRPSIERVGGSLRVELACKIRAGASIPEMSRDLQERVRQSVVSRLGLSDVESVRITIREIAGAPDAAGGPGRPTVDGIAYPDEPHDDGRSDESAGGPRRRP
jgi:uncharacterized alkaline shock family protein YloU